MEAETYTFETPVKLGNQTLTEITITEPTAGMMRKAMTGENPIAQKVILLADMLQKPIPLIEAIGWREFQKISVLLDPFIAADPATGSASSPT